MAARISCLAAFGNLLAPGDVVDKTCRCVPDAKISKVANILLSGNPHFIFHRIRVRRVFGGRGEIGVYLAYGTLRIFLHFGLEAVCSSQSFFLYLTSIDCRAPHITPSPSRTASQNPDRSPLQAPARSARVSSHAHRCASSTSRSGTAARC